MPCSSRYSGRAHDQAGALGRQAGLAHRRLDAPLPEDFHGAGVAARLGMDGGAGRERMPSRDSSSEAIRPTGPPTIRTGTCDIAFAPRLPDERIMIKDRHTKESER